MSTTAARGAGTPERAAIEALDEEIIALLERRRAMVADLPYYPAGPRLKDPTRVAALRDLADRYRHRLGGAGELVARAVVVLCDPQRRTSEEEKGSRWTSN
jgi:hypothetical protein